MWVVSRVGMASHHDPPNTPMRQYVIVTGVYLLDWH